MATGPPVLGRTAPGHDIGHAADVPKAASQSGSHDAIQTRLMRLLLGPDTMTARVRSREQARAQTVDASATTLRRIERDLHDGTQAQLVALAMRVGQAREQLADDDDLDLDQIRLLIDQASKGPRKPLSRCGTWPAASTRPCSIPAWRVPWPPLPPRPPSRASCRPRSNLDRVRPSRPSPTSAWPSAALEEETDSVAGLLLEGVVLRLRADLAWLEACERYWTSRKEG